VQIYLDPPWVIRRSLAAKGACVPKRMSFAIHHVECLILSASGWAPAAFGVLLHR
jgi:hypothetical protein